MNWIQRLDPYEIYKRKSVSDFIIDETLIQIGNEHSGYEIVLNLYTALYLEFISQKRDMLVADHFIRSLVEKYEKHTVYTHMVEHGIHNMHATFCIKHRLHSPPGMSLIERLRQYFKDRTESFDDYYPCNQNECNLFLVQKRIQFFVSMYNGTISKKNYSISHLREAEYILN